MVMILSIGEILFDQFPDYQRVGGAPFNFSYHLKNLGFPARFITRVGDDPEGRELKTLLQVNGFDEKDLQVDQKHRSGKVTVSIDGEGVPVFDIVPNVAFDHLEVDETVRSILKQGPKLIYYGTLIQRTSKGRRFMQEVFSRAKETVRFLCDLNLRPQCYSLEVVEESLTRADVLKLNEEELATIASLLGGNHPEDDQCRYIMERYGIELVALTRGDKGSKIHDQQGSYSIGPVEGLVVADTVGAGDAYASILAIGYLGGWHPERILPVASRFSAEICGVKGGLPDTDLFYDEYLKLIGDSDIGE
jgi:fructokinase